MPTPENIDLANIQELFDPFIDYIDSLRSTRQESDSRIRMIASGNPPTTQSMVKENLKEVGAKVKVKWTEEEIGDSGWRVGWYVAQVQGYCEETDILTVTYPIEPNCTYNLDLTSYVESGKLQLVKAVFS